MKKKGLFIWLITLLFIIEPAVALTKYGTARIQSGELIIVRDNQERIYVARDGEVEVQVNDVLRVGRNSFVVLETAEKTDIKMGSNAIFQVKPWRSRKKTGYLRMLYGKMNFKTKKLEKRKRFRFKTAAATIGVKGTGADCEVGSTGNTGCAGRSGKTTIQGNSGPSKELTTNQMSLVVGSLPASKTIAVQPEKSDAVKKEETKQFAKAAPTSKQSSSLSQEKQALNSGVVAQGDLKESKKDEVDADESLEQEMKLESTRESEEEASETDEAFEEDLKSSESETETVELDADLPVDIAGRIKVDTPDDGTPDLPEINIEDDIEDAVQESKDASGRLILDFEK